MLLIAGLLIYLGIARKMEPLLLVPIGFGVLLVNLPLGGLMEVTDGEPGLLLRVFQGGITTELIPAFIFLGLGALTDFGPLIANPKTLILGAGAQFGVFFAFIIALLIGRAFPDFLEIGIEEAAAIGIIGGADGPTTVFLTNKLAPDLIGMTAVAAYTYMALVPIIQPPIIKALTTKEERAIYMKPQLKPVSRRQKLLFPVIAAVIIILLVPRSAPLIGMFMFGNLLVVSGVTDRLADTAANAFMNILTILLGLSIGAFMSAESFLQGESLVILGLGVIAFAASTAAGILLAKLMNLFIKEKINPMIGAAGLSAVPMASRVVQKMGQQANPRNFLLMHAMGPNVAGVIGTATAAGVFLGILG
ncbi:MAG TPA: sodium ion-translocating decarboxylase subunit beta [Dehalococcoidia bacterium]|nr:sodium ion-translocating decarboxylase subunit beta [Dehalococcoidia bacterium]